MYPLDSTYQPRELITRLVLETLLPLAKSDPKRKCHRLVGGVLVERTVADVVPALETNFGGIKQVLESLMKTYKGKEVEFAEFQKEYGIQVGLLLVISGYRLLTTDARPRIAESAAAA